MAAEPHEHDPQTPSVYESAIARAIEEFEAANRRAGRKASAAKLADLRSSLRVAASYGATEWDIMLERALSAAGASFGWAVQQPGAQSDAYLPIGEFKPGKGYLVLE